MNKYKIPIIGRMIEKREAERKADELLKKYTFYKTEDAMQITVDRKWLHTKEIAKQRMQSKISFRMYFCIPYQRY